MAPRTFAVGLFAILLLGATLRFVFPTADPPWRTTAGVVWHDEGAWTHNARNKALFGEWQMDAWNPMFIAPVFTGLEYASFHAFGVGTWQARLVSQVGGTLAVLLLGLGVARVGGRAAGLMAAGLLATNYVGVMYDRAAIMESSMAAFIVISWYSSVRAGRAPLWGLLAGVCAMLAFFTKAAAAFYVGALALNCAWTLLFHTAAADEGDRERAAAIWTIVGLGVAGALALALFVGPFWTDYRFYNWQMSVTRKPSYGLKAILDRVTWVPILHDIFTRMWIVWALGLIAWLARVVGWTRQLRALIVARIGRRTGAGAGVGSGARAGSDLARLTSGERLLTLWVGAGLAELLVHDVGNERRFVFLIPALVALTAILLARDRTLLPARGAERLDDAAGPAAQSAGSLSASAAAPPARRPWIWFPLAAYLTYLIVGALTRVLFLYEVRPGVRTAAALALLVVCAIYLAWPRLSRARIVITPWPLRGAAVLVALAMAGNLWQFSQWAADRTFKNYEASRALGRLLPPGTLVHGKLANGLALENRIRPIFVGRDFGNYADRLRRNDVPYILTYIAPEIGYEGSVILDVLAAYPHRRTIATFDVAETTGGHDRAALIEKGPP
jgi:4-amino-4-deoxy-L-arabinose transferase-like glycosyltransferase